MDAYAHRIYYTPAKIPQDSDRTTRHARVTAQTGQTPRVVTLSVWAQEGLTVKTQLHEAENSLPFYKIRMPTEFSHKVDPISGVTDR